MDRPVEESRVPGRYPPVEKGLVRIFGRPWGGSKEFMPSTETEANRGPTEESGRGKKRETG